jgi:hypothetical protein
VHREPKADCPCIAKDDKRIEKLEQQKQKRSENRKAAIQDNISLRCRVAALEQAMWGRSFEGITDLGRPQPLAESPSQVLVGDDEEASISQPAAKRRRKAKSAN